MMTSAHYETLAPSFDNLESTLRDFVATLRATLVGAQHLDLVDTDRTNHDHDDNHPLDHSLNHHGN